MSHHNAQTAIAAKPARLLHGSVRLARILAVLALLGAVQMSPAWAQTGRPAISREAARYQFDLRRNFFASPAAEAAARADVLREAAAVNASAARLDGPAALLTAFEAEDRMLRLFRRHDLYLFLRYALDIRREAELSAADALRSEVRGARLRLEQALLHLEPERIEAALRQEPRLQRYRFYIETVRRNAAHALTPEQQRVVSALEPLVGGGDYPRVVSGLRFGALDVDGRSLDVGRDRAEIAANASDQVRREGARRLMEGYRAQRTLFAFMLVQTIEAGNALAHLRSHSSSADEAAFSAYVTEAGYEAVLAEIARRGDFYKTWQRRVSRDPLATAISWRPGRAARAVIASAGGLGEAYREEFAALLDPANGRADLAGGEHRLQLTGTASVYPIGVSVIYMQDYQGSLLDLIVLAHEGGHAVQAQLMHRNGVPMVYAAGPGYFTESFGRFQELLLLDQLHREAREPGQRALLRDALAARLLAVFPSAEEGAIEFAIHKGVSNGAIRTADQLDAAALAAGSQYSIEYERMPERAGVWMMSEGYFMAPMQELSDVYASLLAVRYFALYRRDPDRFRAAYLALLSGGYDNEPAVLLAQSMGIDITAPVFAAETMTALQAEVDALYR